MRYLITNAKSGLSLVARNLNDTGLYQADPGNLQNALWTLLPSGQMSTRVAPGFYSITMGWRRMASSDRDDGALNTAVFSGIKEEDHVLWQLPKFVDEHGSTTMNLIDCRWNKAIVVGADGGIHHVDPVIRHCSAARWALIPFGS
jgi:hypothetical protein